MTDMYSLILDYIQLEIDINESILSLLRKHLILDEKENTAIKDAIKSLKKLRAFIEGIKRKNEISEMYG